MKKKIKYIYTGLRHNGLRIMASESCFKCNGKGTFIKRRIVSSKTEKMSCSCIFLIPLPINWFILDSKNALKSQEDK